MIDKQIIKGLKELLEVMLNDGDLQSASTVSHTIDLIKRQQAEIERYQKNEVEAMEVCEQMFVQIGELRECIAKDIIKAKKEAYKEFAETILSMFPTDKDYTTISRFTIKQTLKALMEVKDDE
jgi:hypothetical protein